MRPSCVIIVGLVLLGCDSGASTASTAPSAVPGTVGGGSGEPAASAAPGGPRESLGSPVLEKVSQAWFSAVGEVVNEITVEGPVVDGPVIFILVDTLRPDHIGPYSKDAPPTPFSSRLAEEGLLFSNAFADAPWTRPSTASLLTGLYPTTHGADQRWAKLGPKPKTMAEHLRGLGYATGAVIANVNIGAAFGFDQGFDHFADRKVMGWGSPPRAKAAVDAALSWLGERTDPRFFFYLHIVDPHDPYSAPEEWDKRFTPPELADVAPVRRPPWEGKPLAPKVLARTLAAYDAEVAYYEHELTRLTALLEEKGWYEEATIIFTSDHGEAFGEHGVFRHAYHMWDEVLRVPLIVRSPRLSHLAGTVFAGLVQGVDVLPSLLEVLGERAPLKLDGRSWVSREAGGMDTVASEVDVYGISGRVVRGPEGILSRTYPVDLARFEKEVGNRGKSPGANFSADTLERWFAWATDPFEMNPLDVASISTRERLVAEMGRLERGLAPVRMALRPEDMKPEDLDHLRALGYID